MKCYRTVLTVLVVVARIGVGTTSAQPPDPAEPARTGDPAYQTAAFTFVHPVSAQQLGDRLLGTVPPGVTILSITYTGYAGNDGAAALFQGLNWTSGEQTVAMPDGIFLCTGTIPPLSNTRAAWDWDLGTAGDPNMTTLLGQPTFDAASLTIGFTTEEGVEGLEFKFMFGSEEFPEYLGDVYNDGFGVFLDGVNISFDPLGRPITINNNFLVLNNTTQNIPDTTPVVLPIEYDGLTGTLTTQAGLAAGQHTLKFTIADGYDSAVDSAVFIAGLTFGTVCVGTGIPPAFSQVPEEVAAPVGDKTVVDFTATDPEPTEGVQFFTRPALLPPNMTLTQTTGNPASGSLSFAPTPTQFGQQFDIQIFAVNNAQVCDDATIRFLVTAVIDLSVADSDLTATPPSPIAGTQATLTAQLHNSGPIAATCDVEFYLDGGPGAGTLLGTATGISVPAEGTAPASHIWSTAGETGEHTIVAVLTNIAPLSGDDPGNNTATLSVTVRPAPDLVVTEVNAPASGRVGESVQVGWVVRNTSSTDAAGSWVDALYLSTDANFDPGVDQQVATRPRGGGLPADQTYSVNQVVQLPSEPGTYWYIARTDSNDALDEDENEGNNVTVAEQPTEVLPVPDLQVMEITAPSAASEADTITITWTVTNAGQAAAQGTWQDQVLLSADSAVGSDQLLGTFPVNETLLPGGSYTLAREVSLPAGAFGQRYVVIRTDAGNVIYEFNLENNNAAVDDVLLDILPPDLVVTTVTAPEVAYFGGMATADWRVENRGGGTAKRQWSDRLYLSLDSVFHPADTVVWTQAAPPPPLTAGSGYDRQVSARLPLDPLYPPGQYYLFVLADSGSEQFESNENNNIGPARAVQLAVPPLPNLQVFDIVGPTQAYSGQTFEVTWTVINTGDSEAAGAWQDRISLSVDAQPGGDYTLGAFSYPGPLAPGAQYTRIETLTIPHDISDDDGEPYYLIVTADALDNVEEFTNESDNILVDDAAVAVFRTPEPDLVVKAVTVPPTAYSGQGFQVDWTVTNQGNGATNAPLWYDGVYLSEDATFGNDTFLGLWPNPIYLLPGGGYSSSGFFNIPQGLEGTYHVFVRTNHSGHVAERDSGNNLSTPVALNVQLPPLPDLQVEQVQLPGTAFSGGSITVTYRVRNFGDGDVVNASWYDRIFLSVDDVLGGNDPLLATVHRSGGLPSQGSYVVPQLVVVPPHLSGRYLVIVLTDAGNQVYEHAFDGNNLNSASLDVILSGAPDLTVSSISLPPTAVSGHVARFSFVVENNGTLPTDAGWRDYVYLSTDALLDAGDVSIADVGYVRGLDTGQSYTSVQDIRLPNGLGSGLYYVIVRTNATGSLFEAGLTQDNVRSSDNPLEIQEVPVDLVPVVLTVPGTVDETHRAEVSWTITNQGQIVTPVGTWVDRLYLSTDTTIDGGDAVLANQQRYGVLEGGQSYTVASTLDIPDSIVGTFYFILQVDAQNQVFEAGAGEGNNVVLAADGAGNPLPVPISESEEGDFNEGQGDPVDLVVTVVSHASEARENEPFAVNWTGRNIALFTAPVSTWVDRVFLSLDNALSDDDLPLGAATHVGLLRRGQSYSGTLNANIPVGTSGDRYVIVQADGQGLVYESNDANNALTGSAPVAIVPAPSPNLVVSAVDAPDATVSGQLASFTYRVCNNGLGVTLVANWYDRIYLSRDRILSPQTDIYLYTVQRQGVLPPGECYDESFSVRLPIGLSGYYFGFLSADSSNAVFESGQDSDNIASDPAAMLVSLPPLSDLEVVQMTVPPEATSGHPVQFSWMVRNNTDSDLAGSWEDAVYASLDRVWDFEDTPLGTVVHGQAQPLNSGDTYTATLSTILPGLLPGAYYLIVRADARNVVPELALNEPNNVGVSAETFAAAAELLTLGVPASGAVGSNQARYYQLIVPAGETVRIQLDSDSVDAFNEVYVSFGRIPTRSDYDFAHSRPFEPDHELLIPYTQAGSYFLLIYGALVPGGPQPYIVRADIVPFSVERIEPNHSGDVGITTLEIFGAAFAVDSTVSLELAGSGGTVRITPYQLAGVDASHLVGRFHTTQFPLGLYDVVVQNPSGETAVLTEGFTLEPAEPFEVRVGFAGPEWILEQRPARFDFTCVNESNVDIPYLLVTVSSAAAGYSDITIRDLTAPMGEPAPWRQDTFVRDGRVFSSVVFRDVPPGRRVSGEAVVVSTTPPGGATPIFCGIDAFWPNDYAYFSIEQSEALRMGQLANPNRYPNYNELALSPEDWAVAYFDFLINELGLFNGVCGNGVVEAENGEQCDPPDGVSCSEFCQLIGQGGLALFVSPGMIAGPGGGSGGSSGGGGGGGGSCGGGGATPGTRGSRDPNIMRGPAGFGAEKMVSVTDRLPYIIQCENEEDASAPAQLVTITNPLDPDFDVRTFRLSNLGFGDLEIEVPPNRTFFFTEVEDPQNEGYLVRITAGLNLLEREAFWEFRSIDPATGEQPESAIIGLLPPNVTPPQGEGFVSYTISARSSARSGDVLDNMATIVFDLNGPIDTPAVFNTIDAGAPTSSMLTLAGGATDVSDPLILLRWDGQDDPGGSGIQGFDVWIAQVDEPYQRWEQNSAGTGRFFDLQPGYRYRAYSQAMDNVNNIEVSPTEPDISFAVIPTVPVEPTVALQTAVTARMAGLAVELPANPSDTLYAIQDAVSELYVGPSERLQSDPYFRTRTEWSEPILVRRLLPLTDYQFRVRARPGPSGGGVDSEFGPIASVRTTRQGDLNGDGIVTFADLGLCRSALGTAYGSPNFNPAADLNGDDRVTFVDLGIVRRNLGL